MNFDPIKMADNKDFEFQLRAEKEFKAAQQTTPGTAGSTYVDPTDGTVYEWDSLRRGWFPKVLAIITN